MRTPKKVDMDILRVFFDPHPGFASAAVSIPQKIKKVADELSGQTMSLYEAVKRLRAVGVGNIDVMADRNYIRLSLGSNEGVIEHIFHVIYYR